MEASCEPRRIPKAADGYPAVHRPTGEGPRGDFQEAADKRPYRRGDETHGGYVAVRCHDSPRRQAAPTGGSEPRRGAVPELAHEVCCSWRNHTLAEHQAGG